MSARFLLDTNICLYIAKYNPPSVRERFQQYSAKQLAMSVITLGQLIGNNDLWIAAHARSQDWALVTNNEKEFLQVDGLRVENWALT